MPEFSQNPVLRVDVIDASQLAERTLKELKTLFLLPSSKDTQPENMTSIGIRKCEEDEAYHEIEGFEHVGSGDLRDINERSHISLRSVQEL